MWLDIEHTDNKKYFTWDSRKFPTPLDMVADLVPVPQTFFLHNRHFSLKS
jgi:alpha-glucosidase (family GH31 glycosyl hydrolase)